MDCRYSTTVASAVAGAAILRSLRPSSSLDGLDMNELFGPGTYVPPPTQEHRSTDSAGEAAIRTSERGQASREPVTVMHQFEIAARKHADKPAYRVDVSAPEEPLKLQWEPEWQVTTWKEYYDLTLQAGRSLMVANLTPSD